MKLQESASLVVDHYVGSFASSDVLIQETLSGWLFENRIQKLIARTKEIDSSHDTHAEHRTPKAIINHLTQQFDPTPGKVHTEHLLKWYQGGHFRQEDHDHIRGLLKRYEHHKETLPFAPHDFEKPSDLHDALDSHLGVEHRSDFLSSLSQSDREAINKGSELVHNDENFEIRKLRSKAHHLEPEDAAKADPHSRRAMQILGTGTSWCTTPQNSTMFETYSRGGPLYWIHDKKNNRRNVFLESDNQFVDEKNNNAYHEFDRRGGLEDRFKPIEHLLHKFNYTKEKKVKNPTPEQVDEFMNSESTKLASTTAGKLKGEDVHKYLVSKPHPSPKVRVALAFNKKIRPDTIHHALAVKPDEDLYVRLILADKSNIRPDTIHHALAVKPDEDFGVRQLLAGKPNIHPDTIHHALVTKPDEDEYVIQNLENHPNMSQKTKDALGWPALNRF